jgi:queuine tRNA-ribosyltransferase
MTASFSFNVKTRDGNARQGEIATPRGLIRTPSFMPVGTAATVKAMFPEDVRASGADIILANTYHLMLRPGAERIAKLGGLHGFMHWEGPILTDSGGYQVMSLAKLRELSEEGVTFQSHIDGATVMLTPERAIEVQCLLGADIQMVLDECIPFPATRDAAKSSMELSLRWAERSKRAFGALPNLAKRCSASSRAASIPSCEKRARARCWRSASTATRLAASRSARGKPPCLR